VQRLKRVKQTQSNSRNLKRVIPLEAVRFANPDDGVDDPSASQATSFCISVLCHRLVRITTYRKNRQGGFIPIYSYRLFFSLPSFLSRGQPHHHLLPPVPRRIGYNTLARSTFLNHYRAAVYDKLNLC
jgi:hypothetical protein